MRSRRKIVLPRYYAQESFDTEEYQEGDRLITETVPYWAIREAPEADSENHSHEIGRAHGEHWANLIADALNAEQRRKARRKVAA